MDVRIALLHGCYLVSSDEAIRLHCQDRAFGADDTIPVEAIPELSGSVTAREFVRQNMLSLMGEDERRWPAMARRFTGEPSAA